MIDIRSYFLISGGEFRPSLLERMAAGLQVRMSVDAGDIGSSGRFKGKSTPVGSALVELTEDAANVSGIHPEERLVDLLVENVSILRSCGADDIVFHLNVEYDGQCNFEIDPSLLKKLSLIDAHLAITCYQAGLL